MKKTKLMIVFGTRPEAVKMAPLVKELKKYAQFETTVCVTAQHREMLDQVLELFKINPGYDLNIMKSRQSLTDVTINALSGLEKVLKKEKPGMVLVHGDTTTTFTGSLAAFYNSVKVGHVEAGLRTFDKYFPYPEEINRKLTGALADLHFAPTETNKANLIRENIYEGNVYITGNTAIDALNTTVDKNFRFANDELTGIDFKKRILAVTAHRRENLGRPLENICQALKRLANRYNDIQIVYSVHLNPEVRETAKRILDKHERISLISPLAPHDMHNFLDRSYMVLTDSGGLQEEAPALGKPVLVLRNETERPEAIASGTAILAGTDEEGIYKLACSLLESKDNYDKMARAVNPYGDGKASLRIARALLYFFGYINNRPQDFKP